MSSGPTGSTASAWWTSNLKVTVVTPHQSNYPNPIGFEPGEAVTVTDRRDDEFPGWIRVRTADGNEGWAPERYLDLGQDGAATAVTRYTARELNTEAGDVLEFREELNGWLWCRNATGGEGWVPAKTVKQGETTPS